MIIGTYVLIYLCVSSLPAHLESVLSHSDIQKSSNVFCHSKFHEQGQTKKVGTVRSYLDPSDIIFESEYISDVLIYNFTHNRTSQDDFLHIYINIHIYSITSQVHFIHN